MASQNYERLTIDKFGEHLLADQDLDPVYIALNNTFGEGLENSDQKCRWLLAYTAFYNCGAACYMSERQGDDFWHLMMTAAQNESATPCGGRWPRGKERRHFRGQQGIDAIIAWQRMFPRPEQAYQDLAKFKHAKTSLIINEAKKIRGVGDWMAFKMADLVDAALGGELDQSEVGLFMYETPRKSALRLWREHHGLPETARPKDEEAVLMGVLGWLKKHFTEFDAPHKPGHPVDMFCLETILCKHLSHLNGHYPLFNDIHEINEGLEPWLDFSKTAVEFFKGMPNATS